MGFLASVTRLGAVAVVALGLTAAASDAAVIYATSVDSYTQGLGVVPARAVQANALGAPDGSFLSLGLGGQAILSFGQNFTGPGTIWEITFKSVPGGVIAYPETVDIFVGKAGVFSFVTSILNFNALTGAAFNFAGVFDQIKVVDTTPAGPSTDGFDIDSVAVTPAPVPLPAAGLLLLSGLGAVAALRRRKA